MRYLSHFMLTALAMCAFAFPRTSFAALAAPQHLELTGGVYTNDTTPTFTWSAVSGASSYDVAMLGYGNATNVGNKTTTTSSILGDGWYTFTVRAVVGGVPSAWSSITFEIDTKGPAVPKVVVTVSGQQAWYSVAARPDETYTAVMSCELDFDDVADMWATKSGQDFFASRLNIGRGTHRVRAICEDGDHNVTTGAWRDYEISSGVVVVPEPTPSTTAHKGDRMKTACPSRATALDVCHAVYYYGDDGKRHIFPDEATYKTWYADWSGIKTVSSSFLTSLPLGEPVTVHPGDVVVKFASSDDVYAVSEGGVLRRYVNEAVLRLDYGSLWQRFLRILPDTWFSHYRVGSVINDASDYDPDRASAEVRDIDDNF